MSAPKVTILGAGLAGISASFHLGHENCTVFEAKAHTGGHIYTHKRNGFTWDEGPHVSFTKHQYVKDLFAKSVDGDFLEYPVHPTNHYQGSWIPHPAQSNLWAVPEPLRTECLNDFLATRETAASATITDYEQWLVAAFGSTFTQHFPEAYTKKYWTLPAKELTTDWVGGRVFYPDVDVVKQGYNAQLQTSTHYITAIRYPGHGGYHRYASLMEQNLNAQCCKAVQSINLREKIIGFEDGSSQGFEQLVSTLPLPLFIKYCNAPKEIQTAAEALSCSEVLLLNFEVAHPPTRSEQWLYVYDENMWSTRINFTDLLSPTNAPQGKCGIQVEVYFSKYRPLNTTVEAITKAVLKELLQMGLIKDASAIDDVHTQWIKWANVIFDHHYQSSISTILKWLTGYGLLRESDDRHPMTDWDKKFSTGETVGDLVLAGRFGQWKYYWTDDCVLRGKFIGDTLANKKQSVNTHQTTA